MNGPRPDVVVVVTGSGTEVGKTWVGCELLRMARSGPRGGGPLRVAARKPAQSFEAGLPAGSTDAGLLAAASGEDPSMVCPPSRSYPVPMAPPMAAESLGLPVPSLAEMVESVAASWPAGGCDLGLIEGAGGVLSPLAGDGHSAGLARAVGADRVVLVVEPALGVINSARLSVAALDPLPVVVHVNRFDGDDELHRRNVTWLRERDRFAVTTSVESLLGELLGRRPG